MEWKTKIKLVQKAVNIYFISSCKYSQDIYRESFTSFPAYLDKEEFISNKAKRYTSGIQNHIQASFTRDTE